MKKGNPQGRINILKNGRPAPKGNKYALGNDGGRPTKWKDEFVGKLIEYFSPAPTHKELSASTVEYNKDGTERKRSDKYIDVPNRIPSIVGFSQAIGVDYTTVYRWLSKGEWDPRDGSEQDQKEPEKFTEFCKAYKAALEIRKDMLISLGMSGVAPASAYIFTAKNLTDMRDEQTVHHDVSGVDEVFDRLAK